MTMHLDLSAHTCSLISLVAATKTSAYPFSVYASTQYITIVGISQQLNVPVSFKPSWFTWTQLMVYSK